MIPVLVQLVMSYPSGLFFATCPRATDPAQPPTFETTTGCPRNFSALLARIRVLASSVPPGAKVTIRLIGLAGYCWAETKTGTRMRKRPTRIAFPETFPKVFIRSSFFGLERVIRLAAIPVKQGRSPSGWRPESLLFWFLRDFE